MEIIGLGVDLADVARVRTLLEKNADAFRRRCFTDHEWGYAHRFADPSERLAARFAGKEAVMKALGTGTRGISWRDIEILPDQRGAPLVFLIGSARSRAEALGIRELAIMLSHSKKYAVASVVGEKNE